MLVCMRTCSCKWSTFTASEPLYVTLHLTEETLSSVGFSGGEHMPRMDSSWALNLLRIGCG